MSGHKSKEEKGCEAESRNSHAVQPFRAREGETVREHSWGQNLISFASECVADLNPENCFDKRGVSGKIANVSNKD